MQIKLETENLRRVEKQYTAKILKNLAIIDRDKLFSDWGYESLYQYLIKGLSYSDQEAYIRVSAARLIRKDKSVTKKIADGSLSLSNAAQVNATLNQVAKDKKVTKPMIEKALELSLNSTKRDAGKRLQKEFRTKAPKKEILTLDEKMIHKFDRLRKEYGNLSSYELLDILLEEKLKTPKISSRKGSTVAKVSRYIPKQVKAEVYTGKCQKCGSKRNLNYDHIKEFALGGTNSKDNIQLLCQNCNQRKEIKLGCVLNSGSFTKN